MGTIGDIQDPGTWNGKKQVPLTFPGLTSVQIPTTYEGRQQDKEVSATLSFPWQASQKAQPIRVVEFMFKYSLSTLL